MFNKLEYDQSPLPVFNSQQGDDLAQQLYNNYLCWRDESSELRNKIWPACDRAFLGIRRLPKAPGFHWVDQGDQGETDLWDAVRLIVEGILLSLMPRDMSWLSVVPFEAESQGVSNLIRDYLIYKHRQAGTRDSYHKHLTQLLVRGTSAIHWTWEQKYGVRRKGIAEQLLSSIQPQVDDAREQLGELFNISPEGIDPVDLLPPDLMAAIEENDRDLFLQYDGPVIRTLDMQDVFLDPTSNSAHDSDVPMAVLLYKQLHELQAARGLDGKPLYGNLDDLEEKSVSEIHTQFQRNESASYLGVNNDTGRNRSTAYVPVLVFHRQVQQLGSDKWLDTYFHVAVNAGKPRLIGAQENPLEYGRRSVYVDTFHDHYNGTTYGISAIEKSLPAWNHKNVVAALTLNAQIASVFPAYNVVANLTVDDRKPNISPGSFNFIAYKPQLGPNFISPVPTPNAGVLLGMQTQKFLGQKILGQTGALGGALGTDPSRNIEQSKTATQIDSEANTTSIGRDNLLEKISVGSIEPMCQGIMEAAFQFSTEDVLHFIVETGGEAVMQSLQKMDLKKKRQLIVTGYHGLQQKNKEIQDLTKALQVIGQGNGMQYLGAGGPLLLREIMLKLLGRFGVKDLDKYKLPDIELIQQTPGGQQLIAGIQQQTITQMIQMLGIPEDQAQQIMAVFMQSQQQQQGPPGPSPTGGPPPQQQQAA